MAKKRRIIEGHTLDEYDKRYGKFGLRKVQKKYADKDETLLDGSNWWLVEDTYYEIPKNPFGYWWKNLSKAGKVALCVLGVGAVTAGVVTPVVLAINHKLVTVNKEGTGEDLVNNVTFEKQSDGSYKGTITYKDDESKQEVQSITVKVNGVLLDNNKYTFDRSSGTITINADAKIDDGATITIVVTKKDPEPTPVAKHQLKLETNPSDIGSKLTGAGEYESGKSVTVTATAVSGYTFSGWFDGKSQLSTTLSFTYTTGNTAKTLTAKFTQNQYTITVTAETGGTVSGGGTVTHGASVTVTATANTGYSFEGWYEGSSKVSTDASYTFTATSNRTLTAKFEQDKYALTLVSVPTGIGTTLTGTGSYVPNTQVTVTATAVSGYTFSGWYDGQSQLSTTLSFTYTTGNTAKTLTAKFEQDKAFESCSWSYISDACNTLENANFSEEAISEFCSKFTINGNAPTSLNDFVGIERSVTVNNQVHKVRVIGTQHDKDTNDKSLALTFEFANIISDTNGNSLALVWNDTNTDTSANYDYMNSSIRKALCGNGSFSGNVLYAQKGATSWSDTYKNKTILSMLPSDLQAVLKTVKKSVGTTSSYTETSYTDKLFMTSTIELGCSSQYDKGFGSTYSYYKNATSTTDASRIKKQVNGSTIYTNFPYISSDSGQVYQGVVKNYAGYNYTADSTGGGYYWLRSSSSRGTYRAWSCNRDGNVDDFSVYSLARGVAPAFCL